MKRTAGGDNILTSKRPRLGMRSVTETDGADSGVSSSSDKGGFYFLAFQALLDLFHLSSLEPFISEVGFRNNANNASVSRKA